KETRNLVKDQTLALTKTGQIKEQPKPVVTLLTPHQSVMIQGKNGVPFPLRWSVEPTVPLFKIEISKDSKFQDIKWETTTKNLESLVDLRAGPGQFYWRVHAASASGQTLSSSKTHGFKVQRISAPVISFPEVRRPLSFELPVDT